LSFRQNEKRSTTVPSRPEILCLWSCLYPTYFAKDHDVFLCRQNQKTQKETVKLNKSIIIPVLLLHIPFDLFQVFGSDEMPEEF